MLHTEIVGEGETLLFLHSGGETGRTDYQDQKAFFAKSHKVIMPDMSGHGYSSIGHYTTAREFMEESVKDLYDTIVQLETNPCHIIASSSSAMIAIILAKRYPEVIKTLAISGIVPLETEEMIRMSEADQENKKALLANKELKEVFDRRHGDNDWEKFIRLTLEPGWYPFDELKDLSALTEKPILCIVGEEIVPEVNGISYYRHTYENIHTAIIPFAGHLVHRDQPELFNAVYKTFLATYQNG